MQRTREISGPIATRKVQGAHARPAQGTHAQALEVPVTLARTRLDSMHRAAARLLACESKVRAGDSNIVAEVLRGSDAYNEYDHYPDGDVFDPNTHAQFYYHAHRGSFLEHGHFHLFMRQPGIPSEMLPARAAGGSRGGKRGEKLCHLIAISMDAFGMPIRLFTVNRWVTDETWYDARDIVSLLDRFKFDPTIEPGVVSSWVCAMVQLFWPQITVLLQHRDRVLAEWRAANPRRHALEDRRLEVLSCLDISVAAQIEAVTRALSAAQGGTRNRGDQPRQEQARPAIE